MKEEQKIIVLGLGGQGILFTGKVIAYSAFLEGYHSSFLPTYGPEVHNGPVKAEVVISKNEIYNPFIEKSNIILVFHKFRLEDAYDLAEKDALLLCKDFQPDNVPKGLKTIRINAESDIIPPDKTSNMLMAGALCGYQNLFDEKSVGEALKKLLSNKQYSIVAQNFRAFRHGKNLLKAVS